MNNLQQLKRDIRAFLPNYTDEKLAAYLAHCQEGKASYSSCCCFIGGATANHALQSGFGENTGHYWRARDLRACLVAEFAFRDLGADDALRRLRLIPILKAELRRRDRVRAAQRESVEELIHA